jgi:2-polyprenyl-3-methyl-5-hydroxy-6-metoxy-1,4-benzoquinol methylase
MADYDGYTSQFAKFRAKHRGLDVKFYDIEKPINDKFDIILALYVLEYVPDSEFEKVINLLKSLKSDGGKIITKANFGDENGKYPMRYEESPKKIELMKRLSEDG